MDASGVVITYGMKFSYIGEMFNCSYANVHYDATKQSAWANLCHCALEKSKPNQIKRGFDVTPRAWL